MNVDEWVKLQKPDVKSMSNADIEYAIGVLMSSLQELDKEQRLRTSKFKE